MYISLVDVPNTFPSMEDIFPYIESQKQKDVIQKFASLVTRYNLTDKELDHLITQAIAYTRYCSNLKT